MTDFIYTFAGKNRALLRPSREIGVTKLKHNASLDTVDDHRHMVSVREDSRQRKRHADFPSDVWRVRCVSNSYPQRRPRCD